MHTICSSHRSPDARHCRGQIACYLSGSGRRSFPSCPKPGGLHLHHQQLFAAGKCSAFSFQEGGKMFRPGLRSAWNNVFSRPSSPGTPWQTFFRSNLQKRTLINSSRDNHWPRSPLLPEGKGFNWDAFRWTNYRVASKFPFIMWWWWSKSSVYGDDLDGLFYRWDENGQSQ
jgi:hypothetical protein